jgi:hypothetical protein
LPARVARGRLEVPHRLTLTSRCGCGPEGSQHMRKRNVY